jgi:hypothetical protein
MPKLTVDAIDDLLEITVTDYEYRILDKAFGRLSLQVPMGVYDVRFSSGRQYQQKLVAVLNSDLTIAAPTFSSAAPLASGNASKSLIKASHDLSVKPFVNKGTDADVFILIGNSSDKSCRHLEQGIALLGANEQPIAHLEGLCQIGDDYAGCCLEVTPGFYILRLNGPAGQIINMPVHAIPNWRCDIFLLHDHDALGRCFIDPDKASIVFTRRGNPFDPEAEGHRKTEAAKNLLLSPPTSEDDWSIVLNTLGRAAFELQGYPMLRLLVANLLIAHSKSFDPDAVPLRKMLEEDQFLIPDVIALFSDDSSRDKGNVANPPLLQASWRRLIKQSSVDTTICPAGSIAATIAEKRWGLGIYAYWQNEAPTSSREALELLLRASEGAGQPPDPASALAVLAKLSPYEEATARGVSQQMQAQQMQYQVEPQVAKSPIKPVPLAHFISRVSIEDTSGPEKDSDSPGFRQKLCEQLDLPWGTIEVILERIRHKTGKVRELE